MEVIFALGKSPLSLMQSYGRKLDIIPSVKSTTNDYRKRMLKFLKSNYPSALPSPLLLALFFSIVLIIISYIIHLLICLVPVSFPLEEFTCLFPTPSQYWDVTPKRTETGLFCSLLYPWYLEQCLAHNRYSINTC